ncbi:hypothetical protein [Halosolutus halophilus]|uniref:hypothetical protein n=1 Tax=Halosolutus halophilus TaxID=1552990 RepID=UPI0022351ED1|nr:hypothetical protein [Halosolutus halophilus]
MGHIAERFVLFDSSLDVGGGYSIGERDLTLVVVGFVDTVNGDVFGVDRVLDVVAGARRRVVRGLLLEGVRFGCL